MSSAYGPFSLLFLGKRGGREGAFKPQIAHVNEHRKYGYVMQCSDAVLICHMNYTHCTSTWLGGPISVKESLLVNQIRKRI